MKFFNQIQILFILTVSVNFVYSVNTKPLIYDSTFCEGEIAIISCHGDTTISLQLANYGRFSFGVCNPSADTSLDINCYSNKTLEILKDKCEGKNECDISVINSIFGNHCPETSKYLEIQYMCVPSSPTTTSSPSTTLCKCTIEEHYENINQNKELCSKFENDDIIFFSILLLLICLGSGFLGALILYLFFKKYYTIVKKSETIEKYETQNQRNKEDGNGDEKVKLQIKRKGSINFYDEIL